MSANSFGWHNRFAKQTTWIQVICFAMVGFGWFKNNPQLKRIPRTWRLLCSIFYILYSVFCNLFSIISGWPPKKRKIAPWLPTNKSIAIILVLAGSRSTITEITAVEYSLLHLKCHFFILKSQSIIYFSRSHLTRFVEMRPRRVKLEIQIKWHSKCNRLYIYLSLIPGRLKISFWANQNTWILCLFV